MPMKESQDVMIQFVKIVERFPVLYDNKMRHRTQVCTEAWEKVAEAVRHELKEECTGEHSTENVKKIGKHFIAFIFTVDELKTKWKGVRSSFTRFKKKLHLENNESNSKPYYLYDSLKFLHVHTRPKWCTGAKTEDDSNDSENEDGWVQNITIKALKGGVHSAPIRTYGNTRDPLALGKKTTCSSEDPEVGVAQVKTEFAEVANADNNDSGILKRSNSTIEINEESLSKIKKIEDNTDLQFFKSLMPDISHFTTQEKRKFKMGVLKLIDEIEESRKNPDNAQAEFES